MKSLIFLFIMMISASSVYSQVESLESNVIPPSPNAASLGKFGDHPVSYYTGTPSVNIPLFNLVGRKLSVPISVSYHTSGIKVEETASSVGLGWTLNAGGAIVRVMNGRPDEEPSRGRLSHSVTPDMVLQSSLNEQVDYFNKGTNGQMDFEPDLFIYNFNGQSGKLFLEKRNGVLKGYPVPYVPLDITLENNKWTIIDESGVKYILGEEAVETTNSISHGSSRSSLQNNHFVSSWYLKKIISPLAEEINFIYEPYEISYCQKASETHHFLYSSGPNSICSPLSPSYSFGEVEILGVRLQSISSDLGRVDFTSFASDRLDLPGDKALQFVTVRNFENEQVKKYEFSYSYFSTTSPTNTAYSICTDPSRTQRLKLDAIKEIGKDGSTLPPHKFFYNSTKLPDKFSNSMDHWGYFNGLQNPILVPKYSFYWDNQLVELDGAQRRAVETAMKAASLEKIQYPTGGYTLFEMEGNEAYVDKDFFPYEQDYTIPMVTYAALRRQDGANQWADFTVDLPEYEPGIKGGTFKVSVIYSSACNPSEREGCGGIVSLENTDTGVFLYGSDGGLGSVLTTTKELFLPNGHYRLHFEMYDGNNADGLYRGVVSGPDPAFVPPLNHKIGGLRVKTIKSYDEENTFVKGQRFTYLDEEDPNKSSGVVVSKPVYTYPYQSKLVQAEAGQPVFTYDCFYFSRSANSNAPLSSTQGSPLGYKWVQVYDLDSKNNAGVNGKQVYRFTTAQEYPDQHHYNFPFAPHTSVDWMRGLQKETHTSRKESNNTYKEVQTVTNEYKANEFRHEIQGLKMGCQGTDPNSCMLRMWEKYDVISYWYAPESTVQVDLKDNKTFTTEKNVFYDQIPLHPFQTRVESLSSYNELVKTVFKYPQDYVSSASASVASLVANHVLNVPIEQQIWKNNKLISGGIAKHLDEGNSLIESSWMIETPSTIQNLVENKVNNLFSDLIPSVNYKKHSNYQYDLKGNIVQFRKNQSLSYSSLAWSYNDCLPVKEIQNATNSDSFYDGFESSGTLGNAKTGDHYLNSGSYTIPLSAPATAYMSYWYWDNDKWNFSSVIPFQQTINRGSRLDDVRVFPRDSKMTTYTYKPLIGISSKTDDNGQITFYEYDTFNRLVRIVDSNKNVIQSFQYNYYGQN